MSLLFFVFLCSCLFSLIISSDTIHSPEQHHIDDDVPVNNLENHSKIESNKKLPELPPDKLNANTPHGQHQQQTIQNNHENHSVDLNVNKNKPSAAETTTTATATTTTTIATPPSTATAADGDSKNINNDGNEELTTTNTQPSDIITKSSDSNGYVWR